MNIQDEVVLAIDTAHACGVVAVFDKNQVYAEVLLQEKMAHGKLICSAIEQVEERLGLFPKKISLVMVGRGPGSFVGLRIALATAMGFAFGRALPLMGFCSHRAIIGSYEQKNPCTVAMKASGDWCYVTHYALSDEARIYEQRAPAEGLKHEMVQSFAANSVVISDLSLDAQALAERGIKVQGTLGPSVKGLKDAVFARLERDAVCDESDFLKPNYVRSPSVTLPQRALISAPIIA